MLYSVAVAASSIFLHTLQLMNHLMTVKVRIKILHNSPWSS